MGLSITREIPTFHVPLAADLPRAGKLTETPAYAVLLWAGQRSLTGRLIFERDERVKHVYVKAGALVGSRSNLVPEGIDMILKRGFVPASDLLSVTDFSENRSRDEDWDSGIVQRLRAENLIQPDALRVALAVQLRERVMSLLGWLEGRYAVQAAVLPPKDLPLPRSRDEEEVAGYAEAMNLVFESYIDIPLDENHIKQLHQVLLKHSSKDARHRGEYKKLPNDVAAFDPDGRNVGVVFETATPFDTPRKTRELVAWFDQEARANQHHILILIAVFVVHFLAIHPFQDGNGRLSRILTTLALLKAGYLYVPYSSLERVVEENKDRYYLALRRAQSSLYSDNAKPGDWLLFFLQALKTQVEVLSRKLDREEGLLEIPKLSQDILAVAREHGRVTVRDVCKLTGANRNTVKVHLRGLVQKRLLVLEGTGKGAWYRT